MKWKTLIPLVLLLAMSVLFIATIDRDTRLLPSPLIDKPAPAFSLPRLFIDGEASVEKMKGQRWMLNVWASWCAACRDEHPLINELAKQGDFQLLGLNYKDEPEDAKRWLAHFGNPYKVVAVDYEGTVGIDWGVYGVPETFLIDENGVIKFKHVGPVTLDVVKTTLLPFLNGGEI